MLCGDVKNQYSLVSQGGNVEAVDYSIKDHCIQMRFSLGIPVESDRPGDNRDICFYVSMTENLSILIGGEKATVFQLSDTVTIQTDNDILEMKFILEEGEGQIVGHIMPGNRLSQTTLNYNSAIRPFDWQIFLRSLRRSSQCRIIVEIKHKDLSTLS